MTTYKQRKAAWLRVLRQLFGKDYVFRKSWHYAVSQCRTCRRLFQVPYKEPGMAFACEVLRAHKCGPPLKGYQRLGD